MAPIPLAHLGHWYGYILYSAPALIVLVATLRSLIAQRRERRRAEMGRGPASSARPRR